MDKHLKVVVEMSHDVEQYLDALHIGSEMKRAERRFERFDNSTSC